MIKTCLTKHNGSGNLHAKIWRILRLFVILLFIASTNLLANGLSQRINLHVENATLKKCFQEIKRQTGYSFFWRRDLINDSVRISLNLKNVPAEQVVMACLSGLPLQYEVRDNIILIKSKIVEQPAMAAAFELPPAIVITGQLLNAETNAPVAYATIHLKGSNRGTMTDASGNFTLSVSSETVKIEISAIGYMPLVFPISRLGEISEEGSIMIDDNKISKSGKGFVIYLKPAESSLDELQVVAYGTTSRRLNTGSISTVKGADIANAPVPSFDAALSGRAPGVQVSTASGVLNNPPVFRIRGTNSISLSSYPLIVIDGVPTFTGSISNTDAANNPLSSVNPDDIESINVLKDADATALYGSRAANGVVLITTKRGRSGAASVNYSGWVGWSSPYHMWEAVTGEQMMEIKNEALENAGQPDAFFPSYDKNGKVISTDWNKYIYRTGLSHSHTLNVSGGNDKTKYYVSVGYTKQEGIIVKNDFERKDIRFNLDHKVGILAMGINASYSNEVNKAVTSSGSVSGAAFATTGLGRLAFSLPTNVSPYNDDGSYNLNGTTIGLGNNTIAFSWPNPVVSIDNDKEATENNHVQSNVYLQLTPVKGLLFKTVYGIDYLDIDNSTYSTPIESTSGGGSAATLNKYRRWIWTSTGQYDVSIADKHNISFLVGTEQQYSHNYGFGLSRSGVADDFFTNINGGWSLDASTNTNGNRGEDYLVSLLSRLNYNFDKKYFLSGSFRRDGYSAFAPGKKYGNFWSVSGAYDIAQETFWKNSFLSKTFDYLKLKASYGTVGNTAGIDDYASFSLYSSGLYNGTSTISYSQAGNKDLTWETSKKLDIGLQLSLFKNVLSADVDYYNNNVDGLIINLTQSASTGLPNSIPTNVGSLYNRGIEASINVTPKFSGYFKWTTNFNFTYNKNKVTSLAEGLESIKTTTSSLEEDNITLPGYPLGVLYVLPTAGVDPQTGERIFLDPDGKKMLYNFLATTNKYTYEDGTPGVTPSKVISKNTMPKFYGGWSNTFSYKNFDLGVMLTYQAGFYVYDGTRASGLDNRSTWNNIEEVMNRWQKPGDVTEVPKVVAGDNVSNGSANPISDWVEKGDFIKLKNVSLGYNLPSRFIQRYKINNFRLYVSAQNLAIITGYKGPDPEVSSNGNGNTNQGVDKNTVPNARTYTVGINIGF